MRDVPRTADTILMVRPYDFGYNNETGTDNEFHQDIAASAGQIQQRAEG